MSPPSLPSRPPPGCEPTQCASWSCCDRQSRGSRRVRRALLPPPTQCHWCTRDQDLLVVHGTAIQGYGHARMICSMVKDLALDLALDQPLTNGPSEQGLNARTGVEVVVKHGKPHADRRFQGEGARVVSPSRQRRAYAVVWACFECSFS